MTLEGGEENGGPGKRRCSGSIIPRENSSLFPLLMATAADAAAVFDSPSSSSSSSYASNKTLITKSLSCSYQKEPHSSTVTVPRFRSTGSRFNDSVTAGVNLHVYLEFSNPVQIFE